MEKEEIRIRPEGWIEELVFEKGHHRCGSETDGYGIYVTKNGNWNNGGVISRPDMARLVELFNERLN